MASDFVLKKCVVDIWFGLVLSSMLFAYNDNSAECKISIWLHNYVRWEMYAINSGISHWNS